MTKLPESVSAAIRYAIALIATLTGAWTDDQTTLITSSVIGLVTVGYGIYRTHVLEKGPTPTP